VFICVPISFALIRTAKARSAQRFFLLPFLDRNPGETIAKEGFTGQADDHEKHNALRAGLIWLTIFIYQH
jgi:hypothetical protein